MQLSLTSEGPEQKVAKKTSKTFSFFFIMYILNKIAILEQPTKQLKRQLMRNYSHYNTFNVKKLRQRHFPTWLLPISFNYLEV